MARAFFRAVVLGMITCLCYVLYTRPRPRSEANPFRVADRYRAYDEVYTSKDPLDLNLGHPTLNPNARHLHWGTQAMVACDVPLCSTMGKDILLRGGNAADAAVTVALCIGSVNLHSSGIGGGGFILSRTCDDFISIDGREMAPQQAKKNMFHGKPYASIIGGLASGVPGELKALDELFRRHGSGNLSWQELFQPVIALNRRGFKCLRVLAQAFIEEDELVLQSIPRLKKNWLFMYRKDGTRVRYGDWISRPQLADTLERIAQNGLSDIFYDAGGFIASSLVNSTSYYGGILTTEDFENYKVNVEEPLVANVTTPQNRKLSIYTTQGSSLGLALVAGIRFFAELYSSNDTATLTIHKLIESFKWLASVRLRLGDYGAPSRLNDLTKKYAGSKWVKNLVSRGKYSDKRTFAWTNYEPEYQLQESRGTAHFDILDKDNNAVSMTTTVNLLFGSLVLDPKTGIIMNNQMDDFLQPHSYNSFGLAPSKYNFVKSKKRPLLSAAPVIIVDQLTNLPDMVIGAAGGLRITTAILNVIARTYIMGLDLLHSVAAPRFHHQLIPTSVFVEDLKMGDEEFGGDLLSKLSALGHNMTELGPRSALNGIRRANSTHLEGVSDYWRKLGEADGY